MDNKVDYYFNKILFYLIKIKGDDKVYKEDSKMFVNLEEVIKKTIEQILIDNKEHLLTDSFLYYVVSVCLSSHRGFATEIVEYLGRLNMADNNDVIIYCLYDYTSRLFINERNNDYYPLPYFMREKENIKALFTDLEKKLYDEIKEYNSDFLVNFSDDGYDNTVNSNEVYNTISGIILSSALLHNDFNEFDRLMTNYMDNPIKVTEKLFLNGLIRQDKYSNKLFFTNIWDSLVDYLVNDSYSKRGIV